VQRERQFSSAMDTACLAATRSSASWLNVDISVMLFVRGCYYYLCSHCETGIFDLDFAVECPVSFLCPSVVLKFKILAARRILIALKTKKKTEADCIEL